jgi:aspartyl-tRNA(Asn)/glutamyl-tRNA(Gln) amidotransferase subunit C
MKIDRSTVDKLAELSKLEFDGPAKDAIINDLNRMIGFVDKLAEVNTDGVEPLIYMSDETNMLREDEVRQEITQQEALKNAPKRDSDYFKVPKVIDKK